MSGKAKAPQSVGALSAIFRDRIHIAFIQESSSAGQSLKSEYNIEASTAILLVDKEGKPH